MNNDFFSIIEGFQRDGSLPIQLIKNIWLLFILFIFFFLMFHISRYLSIHMYIVCIDCVFMHLFRFSCVLFILLLLYWGHMCVHILHTYYNKIKGPSLAQSANCVWVQSFIFLLFFSFIETMKDNSPLLLFFCFILHFFFFFVL